MPPSALLHTAAELVEQVLRFAQPADRSVAEFLRAHRDAGRRDRQVLADTAFAVLRELPLLRHLAESGSGPTSRRLALLAWKGDDAILGAALDAGEREWLARSRRIDRATLPAPLRHNLPAWLAEPLLLRLGAREFERWAASVAVPAPLDLRVNPMHASRDDVIALLKAEGIAAQPTPYSPRGLRVEAKPDLQRLSAFADGLFEVQDEGSQLLALAAGARRNELVVDFCAGAGGKTLALAAQMRGSGRVMAFDVSAHRLAALPARLARSRVGNVYPSQIDDERDRRLDKLAGKADCVLVDAPCSGSGTLRRSPDLKWRHSAATLAELAPLQRSILAAAARLVRPRGRLLYATCSVLEAENEAVAADFERTHSDRFKRLPLLPALQRAQVDGAENLVEAVDLRLWTHRHGTDSFFAALWQRA